MNCQSDAVSQTMAEGILVARLVNDLPGDAVCLRSCHPGRDAIEGGELCLENDIVDGPEALAAWSEAQSAAEIAAIPLPARAYVQDDWLTVRYGAVRGLGVGQCCIRA